MSDFISSSVEFLITNSFFGLLYIFIVGGIVGRYKKTDEFISDVADLLPEAIGKIFVVFSLAILGVLTLIGIAVAIGLLLGQENDEYYTLALTFTSI